MFLFGSPEDTASLYWNEAISQQGPEVADCHYEDMTQEELEVALVYARIAYETARYDKAPDEVIEYIVNQHDEIFQLLMVADPEFRARVLSPKQYITWLGGFSAENIAKYKNFALSAS